MFDRYAFGKENVSRYEAVQNTKLSELPPLREVALLYDTDTEGYRPARFTVREKLNTYADINESPAKFFQRAVEISFGLFLSPTAKMLANLTAQDFIEEHKVHWDHMHCYSRMMKHLAV